jgi:hypothetical protein
MKNKDDHTNEPWLTDVRDRQRNLVFPDTARNEGLFWRNVGKLPWKRSTKAGMGLLALSFYAFLGAILISAFNEGTGWRLLLGMILFCGPLFGGIAFATRRALREVEGSRRSRGKSQNHEM